MKNISLLFVIVFIAVTAKIYGQDINENLQKVGPKYGKLYLQPLADAMGTDVNSNLFYTAYVPFNSKVPVLFNIGIRIRMMNTFMSSEDQTFDFSYQDSVIEKGKYVVGTYTISNAPTIIGNKNAAIAKFTSNGVYYPDEDVVLIGGIVNTKSVPLAIPEITFGTIYGTDASIILLPDIKVDQSKFKMFGFTIRHNLSHYVKNSPVDYSIMAGYQKMKLTESDNNDLWKSSSFFINGQVSKSLTGAITVYGALQYEKFQADVSYNYLSDTSAIPVAFTIDGSTNFRGLIGFTARTGFFAFNLDANLASKFALSCGLNFIIM